MQPGLTSDQLEALCDITLRTQAASPPGSWHQCRHRSVMHRLHMRRCILCLGHISPVLCPAVCLLTHKVDGTSPNDENVQYALSSQQHGTKTCICRITQARSSTPSDPAGHAYQYSRCCSPSRILSDQQLWQGSSTQPLTWR